MPIFLFWHGCKKGCSDLPALRGEINMIPEEIFRLYGSETPNQTALYNSSRGDDDFRMTYIIEFGSDKIAVKTAKNTFTTPERVKGWAELIQHYNNLGIYCPKIIRNKKGEYSEAVDGYLVYAEEFMKYSTADGGRKSQYKKKLYESIGLVAANPAPSVPWHTAYSLYDRFDITDTYDENYECAIAFRDCFRDSIPGHAARAEKLFAEYCRRRADLEPAYRLLPRAVFQGDINESNILIDEAGDFIGLIDFNLSGTETVLNYAFCESFYCLDDDSEIDLLLDIASMKKRDAYTAQRLAWMGKNYKFTDYEKEVFNKYYNTVAPFRWPYHSFFLSLLKDREKYPDGRKYAGQILDWTEYQMTRNDAGSLLP